jgi:hypothetical protein
LYLYTPESYPTVFRTTALGACSAMTRLAGTITPVVGEALLHKTYWLPFITFGIALAIAGILSPFLPFETLGRTLEDVAQQRRSEIDHVPLSGIEEALIPLKSPDREDSIELDQIAA